jgi:hypothetical protein
MSPLDTRERDLVKCEDMRCHVSRTLAQPPIRCAASHLPQ